MNDGQISQMLVAIFRHWFTTDNFDILANNKLDSESVSKGQDIFNETIDIVKRYVDSNPPLWISVKDQLPEVEVEVLVEVDGHRGPYWRNNHNLVAYITMGGQWFEERHGWEPLLQVTHWMPLPKPSL
jgi:hypothetical protein